MIVLCILGGVMGMAVLGDKLYFVCRESTVIKIYNANTLSPLGRDIRVEGMKDPVDMVVCRDDRQLYVADWGDQSKEHCIWRVSATGG